MQRAFRILKTISMTFVKERTGVKPKPLMQPLEPVWRRDSCLGAAKGSFSSVAARQQAIHDAKSAAEQTGYSENAESH
jgi:hypothetical protein